MASNQHEGGARRPDQAQWTRLQVGMASPLWFPFMVAASAGAAWWTYANLARVAAGAALPGARPPLPAPPEPQAPARTVPAEPKTAPIEASAPSPSEIESKAEEVVAAVTHPAAAKTAKTAKVRNAEPAPEAEKPAKAAAKATRALKPKVVEPIGEDLIDAAYAANLGPVPPPETKTAKGGKRKKKA